MQTKLMQQLNLADRWSELYKQYLAQLLEDGELPYDLAEQEAATLADDALDTEMYPEEAVRY